MNVQEIETRVKQIEEQLKSFDTYITVDGQLREHYKKLREDMQETIDGINLLLGKLKNEQSK